jgi:hypothetical protein
MDNPITERSNCRFMVRKDEYDKPQVVLELFQTISQLKDTRLGFEFIGGTNLEEAKKVAALFNEHVLNIFVEASSPDKE